MADPITLTIIALIGVTIAGAVALWHKILGWAEEALFPWVEENYPGLSSFVRQAFAVLDESIAPLRAAIKRAWKRVREVLVDMMVEFSRSSESAWVRRIVTWVVKVLPSGEKKPAKVVVEEEVDWDELPAEVRAGFLRHKKSKAKLDITEGRDVELAVAH